MRPTAQRRARREPLGLWWRWRATHRHRGRLAATESGGGHRWAGPVV